jgi:broad specificity phosphatase PhoE
MLAAAGWLLLAAQSAPASRPTPRPPEPRPFSALAALPPPAPGTLRVYVVRHGQSVGNASNDDPKLRDDEKDRLTERGRAEAEQVGAALRTLGVVRLLHSPAVRGLETATIAARQFEAARTPQLVPAPAFGPLVLGRSPDPGRSALRYLAQQWSQGGDPRLEGGESLADLCARCRKGLVALARESQPVAVVSHGEVLLAWCLELESAPLPAALSSFALSNGAIGAFDLAADGVVKCRGLFTPNARTSSAPR